MEVSYVSSVACREHGAWGPVGGMVVVRAITPRTSVRVPVAPDLPNGKATEAMTPLAIVNEVGEPIAIPLAFKNEIDPVHDAFVPFSALDAVLTTLICKVSELASPTGGVSKDVVNVFVGELVWAMQAAAANSAALRNCPDLFRNMRHLCKELE